MKYFLQPYSHLKPFTIDELKQRVPAAFANQASSDVSQKYNFISTEQVINTLINGKFLPYGAMQGKSRKEGNALVAKHIIKFRKEGTQLVKGEMIPEIVLSTSHDGTSAFKLDLGIYRIVCSNGLVAPTSFLASRSVRHQGYNDGDIIDASFEVLSNCPAADQNLSDMRKLLLSDKERDVYAEAALELKYENDDDFDENGTPKVEILKPSPRLLLNIRRQNDSAKDLLTTFNVIQENLIRGEQMYFGRDKKGHKVRKTTRAVKSVGADLKLNKALWTLANKILELRS
ncbi:unnamed protein product [Diamesa hyperborea]